MESLFRIVCFDEALRTPKIIDINAANACSGPLLILGYDEKASGSIIVRTEMTNPAQPLTSGALLLERLRCGLPTEDCPSWLPEVADISTLPATVREFYCCVSKTNSDVVAIISNELDCRNIVQVMAELAAAPYLGEPFDDMKQHLKEIGKIKIPKAFRERAVCLYDRLYRKKFTELLPSFSKSGPVTVVSPTKNSGKIDAVSKIENVEPSHIDVKDVNSGQSEQPSDLDGGCKGAFTRGLESFRACQKSCENQHLVVVSIESTMSDIPDTDYGDPSFKPKYPIKIDFAIVLIIDTAANEPEIILTEVGSPFPKVIHTLRELCGANLSNARIWKIFHPEVDDKNWQKQTCGDRYDDIVVACKRVRTHLAA